MRRKKEALLWPEVRVGVPGLAAYYRRIPSSVYRYFEDRPLLLARAPDSVEQELILEYHGAWRSSREISERWASRRVVEIQAMNARAPRIHHPDWLVLGLETGGRAAATVRSVLSELELTFFGKPRGGGGIDVLIPLQPRYEAVVVLDLARMLAGLVHDRVPGLAPIEVERNHSRRLIVAPFSPRATDFPYVSLPAPWEAFERSPDPPDFDLGVSDQVLQDAAAILNQAVRHPNDLEGAFVAIEQSERRATNA